MKRQPNIIIDTTETFGPRPSGIGHYAIGIARGLDALAAEGILTYSTLTSSKNSSFVQQLELGSASGSSTLGNFTRRLSHHVLRRNLPISLDRLLPKGAFYFPAFNALPIRSRLSAVVIHDVAYLDAPNLVLPYHVKRLNRTLGRTISNVGNVIAVSEFTKERIQHHFDIDQSRIFVAPPAVDRSLYRPVSAETSAAVLRKYGVQCERYILSVGNLEPRKNHLSLVKAFAQLPLDVRNSFSLLLVGADSWDSSALESVIDEAKAKGIKVLRPNAFVPDEDLASIYSGAQGLAFVPFYEGFGMPPLEAYACGVPVMTTRVASLPESAGPDAIFVECPNDIEEITDALLRLVSISESERQTMIPKFEEHLSKFCWRRSAAITALATLGDTASERLRSLVSDLR